MYLKRLELQGFKSFHTRTVFEFGKGITAVVGPNGSGKSNVAESIRWVFGEQQARSIRARRLEDVIFSGSSQRAAVGMAEVSITLDNAEGWLPVDYTEVVVSRRAFRSGDSEYLINKSKVRMRDVLDLFLRAQVGQNSYAFMGQGLVEEVLVMRPEERRRLLEEAADVRLLRTRLDEARDRLAATRENLDRVNLLIEEIAPRLRQLERQASRAAEHSRLADELAAALRELYTQLWIGAHEAETAARANLDQRQQELAVATQQVKAHEEGVAALATAVEEREKELLSRRARHRAVSDQVHSLEQRLTFAGERLTAQTKRKGEVEAELQSLRDERADLLQSLSTVETRIQSVQPEIDEAKLLIETRRQELNGFEQEYSGIRRRIGDSEDAAKRAQRAASDAEAQIRQLEQQEQRLQQQGERRIEQRQALKVNLRDLGREFKTLKERLVTIEDDLEDAEHERLGLATMVETGRASVLSLEQEAMELNSRLAQLEGRHELLRRLQASAEGIDAGTKYLLGEDAPDGGTRRAAADGLVGLMRDIVKVPPGLERAIEAALAENVQALVFENVGTALAAIEMLEAHEAGRATVYSLDAVKTQPPLNLNRERGIVGVAANVVRCENAFRPLVNVLLGRTIVVETVAIGREMLRRGLGSVVTMDGVLMRPTGAITGGLARASAEAFARQRELEELPEYIVAGAQRRADIEGRLRRERESLEGATAAFAQAEPRLQALRDERGKRQTALLENRGKLILLRSQAMSLWAELRRGEDDHDWNGRRARLLRDRDAALAEAKDANDTLARDREAMSLVSSKRNQAIDAVSEAAAAHAGLEGEAKSLGRQVELLRGSLQRTETRLHEREGSLRQIEAELVTLRESGETTRTELATVREELTVLVSELEPAEGELSHLQGRERALREQAGGARARLMQAERAFLEGESALKLRQDEIENLRDLMAAEGFRPQGSSVVSIAAAPSPAGPGPDDLPQVRGGADIDVDTLKGRVAELRGRIRGLGPVNAQAAQDYGESKERYDFLKEQVDDLTGSEETLLGAIDELEGNIRERLQETFAVVDKEFQRYFESFFPGGKAHLSLTQPDDMANTGIDIVAQPPGKRVNTLAMLSGGERALTSLALLLSLLEAHPSPVCVLDEVDAALDETNVGRFVEALVALEKKTQFIIITHNPRTVEAADSIYGVSMGSDSTSKVLSLRLEDLKRSTAG